MEHLVSTEELIEELKALVPRSFLYSLSQLSDIRIKESSVPFDTVKEFAYGNVGSGGLGLRESELYNMIAFNLGTHKDSTAREQIKKFDLGSYAKEVDVLGEVGKGRKIENSTFSNRSNDYRIAKLKRDHPKVADRLVAGEFKSVSAAEREAGLSRPLLSSVEKVARAYIKLSEAEQKAFVETILKETK